MQKNNRYHSLIEQSTPYIRHHCYAAVMSLGRLSRAPFAGFLTVLVMAVALAFPAGFHIVLQKFSALEDGWRTGAQISLFLKKNVSDADAKILARHLRSQEGVNKVEYLSSEAALADFRKLSGFDAVLDLLPENPFPPVIIIYPDTKQLTPYSIDALVQRLAAMPIVDQAQLDTEWLARLASLMKLGRTLAYVLSGFFGLAVLLIMTNTIRLLLNTRVEEIEVMKLVGATNSFVRRPFLYSGLWLGLFAGLLSFILLYLINWTLYAPLAEVAILYEFSSEVILLDGLLLFQLVFFGILLGWIGARIAVHQHLNRLEKKMAVV
jgi:cell division transport system permease protein